MSLVEPRKAVRARQVGSSAVIRAWHGTNQDFEAFDREKLGLANPNSASRSALFFAMRAETAWDYAHSAARKLLPDHQDHEARVAELLRRARAAERRGDHEASEALIIEAEELESAALAAEPAGARILLCEITLSNPLEVEGASRAVIEDLGGVLQAARAAGHDGVIIRDICDTPSGLGGIDDHIAVFDPGQARILEVHHSPAPAIMSGDDGPEP